MQRSAGQALDLVQLSLHEQQLSARDVGAGAAVQDPPQPVLAVGQVVAAGVEQLQLLVDPSRLGQLPARATDGQCQLEPRPLPLVEGEDAAAEQPPTAVERVLAVPAPAEGLLLPAPSDVIDGGLPEAHDVEGIEHPQASGRLLRKAVA